MHTRVGTPYYIAPEVLARNYNKACDLWSIGVITYILLCGYPPFNGSSDVAIFERVKRGLTSKSFPPEDWDEISNEAIEFISNLLQVDASKRMTAEEALQHNWIVKNVGDAAIADLSGLKIDGMAKKKSTKKKLNGDQLAARLKNFVGLSKLKQVSLNVLAHHLTQKEIADLKLIWEQIDTDNTGTITIAQLREALHANGHHTTEAEMKSFILGLDTDHNDVIDYYEFAASLLARNQNIRDDRIQEIFNHLDKQHHGYITVEDLTEIMGSREHAMEVLGDDFPDGKIHLDEFRARIKDI
uniref:Calmodulin n=1 Tax=Aureoumbra lagunensis TaxID=44058 RepID=A0A7S3JSL1_9STRA